MKSFFCEVFLDDKPSPKTTLQASSPPTAAARALRAALKSEKHKRSVTKYVVRLSKLGNAVPL